MTDDLIARLTHRPPTLKDIREAADALEAQARRIAELEDKLKDEEYISKDTNEMFHEVRDENIDLHTRIAKLEAALKPFADEADGLWDEEHDDEIYDMIVKPGDLRAARAALEKKND